MIIVGIAGGTGSGKSTVAEKLYEEFNGKAVIIRHDDYYKEQHSMTYEQRTKTNYDCPDAFDTKLMIEQLQKLKRGEAVNCPVYDFNIHDRSEDIRVINPAPLIIIDGILILAIEEIRRLLDIKIFVDTEADVRIIRRIKRDMNERSRSLESVVTQYLTTAKPMHEKYVEPSKKYADIIIPAGGKNEVSIGIVKNGIKALIK